MKRVSTMEIRPSLLAYVKRATRSVSLGNRTTDIVSYRAAAMNKPMIQVARNVLAICQPSSAPSSEIIPRADASPASSLSIVSTFGCSLLHTYIASTTSCLSHFVFASINLFISIIPGRSSLGG